MALYTFRLPDIGEGIAEAEIVAWHVAIGDRIEEDGKLADLMTDKATVEMESPVGGILREIAGQVGDVIAIGSALAVIEVEGEAEEEAEASAHPSPKPSIPSEVEGRTESGAGAPEDKVRASTSLGMDGSEGASGGTKTNPSIPSEVEGPTDHSPSPVLASPAVRARAKELGVDLRQVKPAAGARVRHSDLDAYLAYAGAGGGSGPSRARPDEPVRVIGMRRRIAENMAEAKRHIPHFTYVDELDVTLLEEARARLNAVRGDRPKLTLLPFLVTAICRAIPDFPMINARYDDQAGVVTRHGAVHLGIAAQTDRGLMVPVVRNAQDRSLWDLAAEIARLAEAARTGKAKSEELSGSTLTVTSLGPLGGIATTPVINRPEVAIIGPNKIVDRLELEEGEIVVRKKMNLSISCDHRVVDGHDAASFVQALKTLIEEPLLLLSA